MSGITRDDVLWCFERLLGRQLDDESAVEHFLSTESSFQSLVRTIALSAEFLEILKLNSRAGSIRDGFVYDDKISTQNRILKILRSIRPKAPQNFGKTRIGGMADGGYVMIDDFAGIKIAYSLGINEDIAWDKEIADLGIDIYQYDHTIDSLPEQNDRFHWFKTGISDTKEGDLDTLPNLVRANGHETSRDLLLKCDIEGFEWKMLASMTPQELSPFRQIVLETHGWGHVGREDFGDAVEASIANLSAGHSLVHVHANNHAAYTIIGGVPIPTTMEMTFVRNDSYILTDSTELFPGELDAPCNEKRAEYHMGHFRF